jgi:hypothetical protein
VEGAELDESEGMGRGAVLAQRGVGAMVSETWHA